MKRRFCRWILHLMGWRTDYDFPVVDKAVLCLAPHTSNWDFIVGKLIYSSLGRKAQFLIKRDWVWGPIGWWMRRHGAIAVNRDQRTSMTDRLVQLFAESDTLNLTITPEGTRKRNPNWKMGFYYIALGAQVPILLYALDYQDKEARILEVFYPTGDAEADLAHIQRQYQGVHAKYPQQFATQYV